MGNQKLMALCSPLVPQRKKVGEQTYQIVLSDHVRKDGLKKVYLLLIKNRKKVRVPLDLYISPDKWDEKKCRATGRSERASLINRGIETALNKCMTVNLEAQASGIDLSLQAFKQKVMDSISELDFLAFMRREITYRTNLSPESVKKHVGVWSKLRRFRKNEPLPFSEMDKFFFEQYMGHMRKSCKNSVSTVHSNMRVIKTYMNRAKDHGYKLAIEAKDIKVTAPTGKIDKLSQEEVKRLVEYYKSPFIPDHHKKTLQCFLFSCYSGIRYGDLQQIKRSHLNGRQLLIIPNKTKHIGKTLNVQLSLAALSLLNDTDPCFDYIYCNQKMNVHLKQIAKVTKVFPRLTFHMSRHTFATNFLERGGAVHDLQLFMGHSFIKETMRYVHPSQESLTKAISVFDSY